MTHSETQHVNLVLMPCIHPVDAGCGHSDIARLVMTTIVYAIYLHFSVAAIEIRHQVKSHRCWSIEFELDSTTAIICITRVGRIFAAQLCGNCSLHKP